MTPPESDTPNSHSTADIARSLPTARDVAEVLRRVAGAALELTDADGAYVEQVVDDQQVQVVAGMGKGGPPVGTRVGYPGSATEEIVKGGSPIILADLEGVGVGIAPYLGESCAGCAALLAPLQVGAELLGSLVLLRAPGRPFGEEHLTTVRTLGDLASVSLRLVEEISREREERTALLDSTEEGIYGIDPAGRCTFLNRSGALLLGYHDRTRSSGPTCTG